MEKYLIGVSFTLMIFSFTCSLILIFIFYNKRKVLINNYQDLLKLKGWYEKISEETGRSYIVERVDRKGKELVDQLNLLNSNLLEIQEQHRNLQEFQQKLHENLLKEHHLLNQYFQNYS